MSNLISRCLAAATLIVCGAASPAAAQHGGHHHGGHHHGGHYGGHHHGGHHHGGYHHGWLHVVPHHHHYRGLYYAYGGANYYTPYYGAAVPSYVQPQVAGRPVIGSTPGPIAPQSVKLEFGGFQRTDDLAARLEMEANRWCLEMHYNYSHNPDFAATYREAYQVLAAAKYVRSPEGSRNREEIRKVVAAAEPVFHAAQERTKGWTREERRPVGVAGANAQAEAVESILHHLVYDVGIEAHVATAEEEAPPPTAAGSAPTIR